MSLRRYRLFESHDWLGWGALAVVAGAVILSVIYPLLPLGNPDAFVGPRFVPPGEHWLLGTDGLGRAQLPRVLEGMRTTFFISITVVTASTVSAVIVGTFVGLIGGAIDQIVARATDVLFAFPSFLLSLFVVAILGPGVTSTMIAIFVIGLPFMIRIVRAATLVVAERDFVTASQIAGASRLRMMFVHVTPNIAGIIVVQATYMASVAMFTEGTLSFLGLGVVPPNASLGSLVQAGTFYLAQIPELALIPGAILATLILSLNLLGDSLSDRWDPNATRRQV